MTYIFAQNKVDTVTTFLNTITTINGKVILYYPNGQLASKTKYKNGLKYGKARSYYENGQISRKGRFRKGEPFGIVKGFDELSRIKYKYGLFGGMHHYDYY